MDIQDLHRPLQILLAFDGSQHSLAAIQLICDLPLPEQSKVTIVGVLIPRDSSNHAIMEAALEQAGQMFSTAGVSAQIEMILGNPAEKIIEFAETIKPDLIVAGAKGLRHTLGILLGGVAQQIVEYAQQPVLVVRSPYRGIQKVLFVTDGSLSSQTALAFLAGVSHPQTGRQCEKFPLPPNMNLTVMNVLPPLPSPELLARSWPIGPDMLPPIPVDKEAEAEWIHEEETRGKELLANTVGYLGDCARITARSVLRRGDAATEIIQYAREQEIDLILAGSRGLSEVRGWLLGSVSRKLVHYSACSVLIVKGKTGS